MNHLFIINPNAGKGHAPYLKDIIKDCFKDRNEEFIIEVTKAPGDATKIAKKYVNSDNYRVYSVGGDGTLNEVVNGMVNSKSSLATIPTGSGNDFLRTIYNGKKIKLKEMILANIQGEEKLIDLAKINDRYFINISSVGFDADVVNTARKFKKLPLITGSTAYFMSIIVTIFQNKKRILDMEIDDNKLQDRMMLVAAGNGRYYGGGMKALPKADFQDELLDICLIHSMSRLRIFSLFPKYMKGNHDTIKEVTFKKIKKAIIKSEDTFPINADGETLYAKEVLFEIVPKGIKIVVPKIL
jgi:diacylglycerol kinase (ATP)